MEGTLGKGSFGEVILGEHLLTNEKVAIKVLEKNRIKCQRDIDRICREIKILNVMQHKNVIMLYEIIETDLELLLVMEYCEGGELFDYIVERERLTEAEACYLYIQMIAGIQYIHQNGVCHRDLKPENLLLDYDNSLKIVDFGLSNLYEKNQQLSTACGSPCYASPEMIKGESYDCVKSDIWSSGVVLYAMICGYLPFENQNTAVLEDLIINADFEIPSFVSDECKDLLYGILNADPAERFSIEDIQNHPWTSLMQLPDQVGSSKGSQDALKKNTIQVDDSLLCEVCRRCSLDVKDVHDDILQNKHNKHTSCYYILKKKYEREEYCGQTPTKVPNYTEQTPLTADETPENQIEFHLLNAKERVTQNNYSDKVDDSSDNSIHYVRRVHESDSKSNKLDQEQSSCNVSSENQESKIKIIIDS